ncbi:MAG: tetratricopeptide repeat protein [Pseudomonadales bacterium]
MLFNKALTVSLRRCLTITLLLGLGACSTITDKPAKAPQPSAVEVAEQGGEVVPVLPPNPYYEKIPRTNDAAKQQFQQGVAAMQNNNWSEAESAFNNLVNNYPRLSGPHLNLGIIARQKGDFELSKQHFSHAIEVNPSNQEAYNQLALLHREQGEFKQAEKTFLQAIEIWPGYASIQLNLGILYELYMGEMESALQHYQNYQQLQSEPDKTIAGWIIDLQRRIKVASR